MEIEFYKTLAAKFRKAFEDADLSNAPGFLSGFPKGCCHWASLYIGQFLQDEYGLYPQDILGESHKKSDIPGHHWIEVENIIIDITADQVKDKYQLEKVIVCNVEDSKWHNGWERRTPDQTFNGFLRYDQIPPLKGKTNFTDIYNMICEQVRNR